MITASRLKQNVMVRGGFTRPERVDRAIDATLQALGERLAPLPARTLRKQLPPEVARKLDVSEAAEDTTVRRFYERVSELESERIGIGIEHAQVVCQILGELIDQEARAHLRSNLPPGIGELFAPRRRATTKDIPTLRAHAVAAGFGSTLASGRPGSLTPLSEGSSERAQRHSVMRSANPHGDTKISSATVAPEHRAEPLSEGQVGSSKPLSESKD